jgi:hypothetical protein
MGTRKSNDSVRTGVRAGRSQTANEVRDDGNHAGSAFFLPNKPQKPDEHVRELVRVVLRLRAVYGTALATEFALRQQDAESDRDFAQCLRWNVCGPIGELMEEIQATVEHMGGQVPEPLP